MIELGNILRGAGLTVAEYPGWRTRGHAGTFAPLGGVWHHTGGLKDLDLVAVTGRPDLAAPLANLFLDRAGVWHVVAAGVAYHAGPGHGQVLRDIRAGIEPKGFAADLGLADDYDSGNHYLLGVEVEDLGTGDPGDYPAIQVSSLVLGSAAICRELHWTEAHWVHHREWTARKVDMSLAEHTDLRALVAAELHPAAAVPPVTNQQEEPVIVITTPAGPDHRGAAVLTPSPSGPLARYLSQNEWRALSRLHDANPAAVIIEERPVAEHDYLTGGPKK